MTTIIRDYREGELIPDASNDSRYTFEELDGGIKVGTNDIAGVEGYLLRDGRIAVLQSIDLDWKGEDDHSILATVSAPHLYK